MFKNSEVKSRVIDIDGEKLTDPRFADDVALSTRILEDMEAQLNFLKNDSKKRSRTTIIEAITNYEKLCYRSKNLNRGQRN